MYTVDLTNKKFHRLTALYSTGEIKRRSLVWHCICECGSELDVTRENLQKGHTKSCGCLRKDKAGLNAKRLRYGEASFNVLFHSYKTSAKERGIEFRLSRRRFKSLTQLNCSYCGSPPSTIYKVSNNGEFIYNGIDRIDNLLGYSPKNSIPCCKLCNFMKRDLSAKDFISHIKKINSHYNSNKELLLYIKGYYE